VDFCPYCKKTHELLREKEVCVAMLHVKCRRFDVDPFKRPKLMKKLDVSEVPQFLLLSEDGAVLARKSGKVSREQLLEWIQEFRSILKDRASKKKSSGDTNKKSAKKKTQTGPTR
ncbi:MAG: thioredoxin family protein, partial [Planctomycetales bacterium]